VTRWSCDTTATCISRSPEYYPAATFGQQTIGEPDYRASGANTLREQNQGNWVLMPPYPYSPTESLLDLPGSPPNPPSRQHIFGTDDRGRDIFARLAYGFNVSLSFALLVLGYEFGHWRVVGACWDISAAKWISWASA
jgi:microcin C transport system permease protein